MIFRSLGNTIFCAVNARLQICGLLLPVIFPKKFDVQFQKRLTYMAREKIHSFYAFELMIQFLTEEGFLNMHSDILMNFTPGV